MSNTIFVDGASTNVFFFLFFYSFENLPPESLGTRDAIYNH